MLSALHVSTHLIKGSCHLKSLLRIITASDLILLAEKTKSREYSSALPVWPRVQGTGSVLTPVSAPMEVSCEHHKVHKFRETRGAVLSYLKPKPGPGHLTPSAASPRRKAPSLQGLKECQPGSWVLTPCPPPHPRLPRLPVAGQRRFWARVSGLCTRAEQTAPTAARANSPQTRLLTEQAMPQ